MLRPAIVSWRSMRVVDLAQGGGVAGAEVRATARAWRRPRGGRRRARSPPGSRRCRPPRRWGCRCRSGRCARPPARRPTPAPADRAAAVLSPSERRTTAAEPRKRTLGCRAPFSSAARSRASGLPATAPERSEDPRPSAVPPRGESRSIAARTSSLRPRRRLHHIPGVAERDDADPDARRLVGDEACARPASPPPCRVGGEVLRLHARRHVEREDDGALRREGRRWPRGARAPAGARSPPAGTRPEVTWRRQPSGLPDRVVVRAIVPSASSFAVRRRTIHT